MRPFKRPILTIFYSSLTFIVTVSIGVFRGAEAGQASLFNTPAQPLVGIYFEPVNRIDPEAYSILPASEEGLDEQTVLGKYGEWSYCDYRAPEAPEYGVDLQEVEVQEDIESGQVFQVDMSFMNNGNVRLFAEDSGCYSGAVLNVGTQKAQDRSSVFGASKYALAGWTAPNRIKMTEPYVDPGDVFNVSFESLAPEGDDIYREYYQPVVEGVAWVGEAFGVDIEVGEVTEAMKNDIQFVDELSIQATALAGLDRNLEIVLAEQMMYARFGELRVWSMQISSGHWETPTPKGNYQILSKQELRVGSKWPHYHMPYFQLWRSDGYGIHALPYLANDGGAFWYEALNHIGIPVSHGCVRTLPEDAVTAYQFTEVGNAVWIH